MATEQETVGTIVQKLALDMKEFETSVKKAEGLSKALKTSMSELGTLTVDPSGKLKKTLDDYSVSTEHATESTRHFFREQRMQDRIFKESIGSITGAVFAFSLLTKEAEGASGATKRVRESLMAGVEAANAAEFGFFGIGKTLSRVPGVVGAFGSSLMGLGGPIAMAIGLGASLVSFFTQVNEESKKAADEGIKKYAKAVEDAASSMDKFLPQVEAAQEQVYRNSLSRVERQLALFKRIQDVAAEGDREFTIGVEEASAAGLTATQLGAMTPAMIRERVALLEEEQRKLAALLNTVGNTVERAKPALRPGDLAGRLPGPPKLYGPEKPAFIDQEYEAQLRYIEGGQRLYDAFIDRRERMEEKLAEMQERLNERIASAREASWQRDIAAAQNIGAVLQSSFNIAGDSLIGKMLQVLQIALSIAKAIRFANSAEGSGFAGTAGIIGSVLPIVGLFLNKGGAPGSATDSVNNAYSNSIGTSSPRISVSGRVDLSNGKLFLIQEMPGYTKHLASKAV